MDRQVPRAPEDVDVGGVPPVTVEISVRKAKHLAQHVEIGMETEVEPDEPQKMVWNLK